MGFGWLFLGCFFAHIMEPASPLSFAMLAGYPMMIIGLWQLAHYHTRFLQTFYVALVSLPFAVYYALCGLSAFGIPGLDFALGETLAAIIEPCYFVYFVIFSFMVLYAIAGICKELGLYSLMTTAWRNFLLMGILGVFKVVTMLPIFHAQQLVFSVMLMLFRLICVVMNLLLCYKCYRYICPEGQEDHPAPEKKTKRREEKHDEN